MTLSGKEKQRLIPIRVDDREARGGVLEALNRFDQVRLDVARLAVGDYEVDGLFVVERKTLPDLAISIQDGRLFRQAAALAGLDRPRRGVLLLEGVSGDLARHTMRWEAIQGALITVSLFYGVPVLRSRNPEESARLMLFAAQQAHRFAQGALPRHGRRPRGKRKAQLTLLQQLPGIGPERAERLLKRFGAVEDVVCAEEGALAQVPGIGKGTAKKIRWLVQEERVGYDP